MKNQRSTGIFLSYVYLGMNMIIGLFMSSYVLRMLGDTEYGLYQTVGAFANYLILLEFGMGTVLTRNLTVYKHAGKKEDIDKCISTLWIITIALSIIVLAIAGIFMVNIGKIYSNTMTTEQVKYGEKVFLVIVVNLIISFFMSTANGMLLGFENYTFANRLRIIKLILRTVIAVIALNIYPMALVLTMVDSIISFCFFAWTIVICRKKYYFRIKLNEFDIRIVKDSLPLCLALLLQTVINQANNQVDKTVLGIRMNLESVAIYSIAQYIYSVFSSITTVPISMYMPEVAKNITCGLKGRQLTDTLVPPCRLVVILGGMIMFGFIAVGKPFISIVYGEKYLSAWLYAIIIIVPMFINMTNGVLVNVLDVLKKRMVRSYILLGTTILNICLTVYLIDKIGIIGAVIATAISVVIGQDIVMNIYYARKTGIAVFHLFAEAYRGLIPVEIFACCISTMLAYFIQNNYISLFAGGMTFVALCLIGFVFYGLNNKEKEQMRRITQKIRAKVKFH